jgi:hypothetical protein
VLSAVSYLDRVNFSIAGGAIVDASTSFDRCSTPGKFSALVAGYALFQTLEAILRIGSVRDGYSTGGVGGGRVCPALTALVPANVPYALLLFVAVRFCSAPGSGHLSRGQSIRRALIPVPERGIANGWILQGSALAPALRHLSLLISRCITVGARRLGMRGRRTLAGGVCSSQLATLPSNIRRCLPRNSLRLNLWPEDILMGTNELSPQAEAASRALVP